MKTLFTYLTAFSRTGGIESFNRSFMAALEELGVDWDASGLHDRKVDEHYVLKKRVSTFKGRKFFFILQSYVDFLSYDVLILGHINLALLGFLIKLLYGKQKKLILIAHGIEVWGELSWMKKYAIRKSDTIIAVSSYTREKLEQRFPSVKGKVKVLNNTFDRRFHFPERFTKDENLLNKYSIPAKNKIILTLARISSKEGYKGYDRVIKALQRLEMKNVTYLLAGKYDEKEKLRLDELIRSCGLQNQVVFTGFVPDEELISHYQLADAFVMPSTDEGFGIVYIEAMACGVPVLAGNKDGSVDALKDGELGVLVDPESIDEIAEGIKRVLENPNLKGEALQNSVVSEFGFERYKEKLGGLLSS